MKKVLLIVRDGWGIGKEDDKFNAVRAAKTPNMDFYLSNYPNTILDASGEAVGLPKGYQGSSEVGHLNMGAGRIVIQELKRIKDMIEDGSFFETENIKRVLLNAKNNKRALHLMGLVQDEGVHAHQDHMYSIINKAVEMGISPIYIHFFADGRDTPPRSGISYLKMLLDFIKDKPQVKVATVMGRYYAMDRNESWNLTDMAYDLITRAKGKRYNSPIDVFEDNYKNGKQPNGSPMVDEYIPPSVVGDYKGMDDGDSVIHFNFRQDRAIQLTKAFVEDDYKGNRWKKFNIVYCGLTRYYDEFKYSALPPMDESGNMNNLLGEVISNNNLKQLRISETQKFKHVTSFFNGKRIEPYKNEDRIEIKGRFDPSSFAEHPEMEAYIVSDRVIKEIDRNYYDFILLNFANCDMVGHTGNFESVKKAVEVVDECVGKVTSKALEKDYVVMITADHGNAEEMWDYKINMPKTSHTTNPVEFVIVGNDIKNIKLRERGILSDIALTVLYFLDIKPPEDMTSKNLIL